MGLRILAVTQVWVLRPDLLRTSIFACGESAAAFHALATALPAGAWVLEDTLSVAAVLDLREDASVEVRTTLQRHSRHAPMVLLELVRRAQPPVSRSRRFLRFP